MARASSDEPWRTSEKTKWTDWKINKKGQHPWRTYNILQGKLAVTETVSKLLKKKVDDLETYSWMPCLTPSGVKKEKNENMENLTETIIDKLELTGTPKEELKTKSTKHQYTTSDC